MRCSVKGIPHKKRKQSVKTGQEIPESAIAVYVCFSGVIRFQGVIQDAGYFMQEENPEQPAEGQIQFFKIIMPANLCDQ